MEKIYSKKWLIDNWQKYEITCISNESEFVGLLNILQSHNLTLDDMHNCVVNGECEFMTFWNYGGWATMDDLYQAILKYNTFFDGKEFIEWILEKQEDLKHEGYEPVKEIKKWTYAENWMYNGHHVDTMIVKTDDGYVLQITY